MSNRLKSRTIKETTMRLVAVDKGIMHGVEMSHPSDMIADQIEAIDEIVAHRVAWYKRALFIALLICWVQASYIGATILAPIVQKQARAVISEKISRDEVVMSRDMVGFN